HGLKAYPSARSDDQDFRHGVMLLADWPGSSSCATQAAAPQDGAGRLHMKGCGRECVAKVPTMRRQGAAGAVSGGSESAASVALAAAWGNPFNSFDHGAHRPFAERDLRNASRFILA